MCSFYTNPTFFTPSPLYSFTIPFPHKIVPSNFFVGFRHVHILATTFHFDLYVDLVNSILKGAQYSTGSGVDYEVLAFYGYNCSVGYYFNENQQQCAKCFGICIECYFDQYQIVRCNLCDQNFSPTPDQLSCVCSAGMKQVASVCDDFAALNLVDCANAERIAGTINCLFCTPQSFRTVVNNLCVCMQGYDDDDADGLCQETCGDKLIFHA
jgi:hypothetical protein